MRHSFSSLLNRLLILAFTSSLMSACIFKQFGGTASVSFEPVVTETPEPLVIAPSVSVIHPQLTSTLSYSATGGVGTKTFAITSGSGTIGAATGDYSVDTSNLSGVTEIALSDSASPATTASAKLYQIATRFNGAVTAVAIQNGFGYFAGDFTAYNPQFLNGLGKLNATTGDLAAGCNLAGLLGPYSGVTALAETSTHLFAAGSFESYADQPVTGLIKIHKQTCALDTTFSQSSGSISAIFALAISGNSLYLGGNFTSYRGAPAEYLAKVDVETGELDTTFTSNSGFNNNVSTLVISGTSLYAGGNFTTYRGVPAPYLAKLALDTGSLDTTFTQATGMNNGVTSLVASEGALYAGGYFTTYRGTAAERLAKLNLISGDLDTTFTQSTGLDGFVDAVAIRGSAVYVGGQFTTYRGAPAMNLVKIDSVTGDLDSGFAPASGPNAYVTALAVSDTALYMSGGFTTYRGATAKYLAKAALDTGALDTTFTQSTGLDEPATELMASDGSVYLGGSFRFYRGSAIPRLAKVDLSTGTLDTTFTQGSGPNGGISALALSGSSLYLGGNFTSYRGTTAQRLAKVDLGTGDLDTTFTQSTGANSEVKALVVAEGALYLGGSFSGYRGVSARRVAKVDLTTGALITAFTSGTGANSAVYALAASGTSLYLGGTFSTYRGTAANRVAKVDLTSGNLDTTFSQASGPSYAVTTLAVSGTSLYLGGGFSTYRGTAAQALAKVDLATGALDTTFTQSVGMEGDVTTLAVAGSSLYVGGGFGSYRGQTVNYLAKIDLDSGNLDTTFSQSLGLNDFSLALAVSGNTLLVGGAFTHYRGSGVRNASPFVLGVDLTTGDLRNF